MLLVGLVLLDPFPWVGMSNAVRLVSDSKYKHSYGAVRFAIAPGAC